MLTQPVRQITQVAVAAAASASDSVTLPIVALCNDGTLWSIDLGSYTRQWQQLPPVPQPSL